MSHPDAFSLRRDFMLGKASAPIYGLEDVAALSRCACAVAIGAFDGVPMHMSAESLLSR